MFLQFLHYMGQLAALVSDLAYAIRTGIWRLKLVAQQIVAIGYGSQVVVIVTGAFTGAVFTFQSYAKFKDFGVETGVGAIVSVAMCRELGPVLAGLMVAGRVGASMAADIGTMKVTEQIDALVTLSTNPLKYLAVPRVVAATLAMPVLVATGDAIGIMGGWLVGITRLDFNSAAYLKNTVDFLEAWDVGSGLVKGAVFGFIVALMGCYHGMNSARGAQGVGAATKSAVVSASVLILAANYVLTEVFFSS